MRFQPMSRAEASAEMRHTAYLAKDAVKIHNPLPPHGVAALTRYSAVLDAMAADTSLCELVPMPEDGDWLDEHPTKSQSFVDFLNNRAKIVPPTVKANRCIALVALGDGVSEQLLSMLGTYLQVFYQIKVQLLGPLSVEAALKSGKLRSRINGDTRKRQLFAADCIKFVREAVTTTVIRPGCAMLAITMEDFTKNKEWNFLYGMASGGNGVFSMARFSPRFFDNNSGLEEEEKEKKEKQNEEAEILKRSCKVMSHEFGHIFGISHCTHFRCLMNGVNHVSELQRQLMLECPSCTKKLTATFGWDLRQRYEELAAVMKAFEFEQECEFISSHVLPHFASKKQQTKTTTDSSKQKQEKQTSLSGESSSTKKSLPPQHTTAKKK